ncbi:helix-turn-helix domain-containing protein [Nocardioides pantholopis]|uniref:helix-turn-helix domain-containing protein n=1 Tax=Nocardioides pantholopis TaxID=2483798 RepID=UPI0019D029E3|nr:helix-turn-helix domain-containing protein [Nocardioides pantholopis]
MGRADEDRGASEVPARWRPDDADLQVLALLAAGHTVEVIARRTGVSERTVRRRLRSTADGMGVDSTIEAVVQAVRRGLI